VIKLSLHRRTRHAFAARKTYSTIVVFLCAIVAIASCSSSGGVTSGTKGTYSLLSFFPQTTYNTWLRGQVKVFEASHPGVIFSVQYTTPTYIIQKLNVSVAAGTAPDIATGYPGAAQLRLNAAGKLLNYTPYVDADPQWRSWVAGWSQVPEYQYRMGSDVFADNVSLGPPTVWYWKNMLAKVGYTKFPTTISGLISLTKALKKAGLPTMAYGMNSQALFDYDYIFWELEANWDPGGVLGTKAELGEIPWTAKPFVNAANLLKTLYDDGIFYSNALSANYDPDQKVQFGERLGSSAWQFGPWMDGYYPNSAASEIGVSIFPTLHTVGGMPAFQENSNDMEWIIPQVTANQKTPAHIKLMLAFAKQLNSPESQRSLWQQGIFPVLTSVTNTPNSDPWAPLLKEQIQVYKSEPVHIDENTYPPNTQYALDNGLEELLLGKVTVSQLLQSVQTANKQDYPCSPACKNSRF
jgi:raffinose/stachyose/melibiose transport system substrate-binding protein